MPEPQRKATMAATQRPLRKRMGDTVVRITPIDPWERADTNIPDRWTATCERHGFTRGFLTKTEARMRDVRDWCPECAGTVLL